MTYERDGKRSITKFKSFISILISTISRYDYIELNALRNDLQVVWIRFQVDYTINNITAEGFVRNEPF